MLFSEPTATPSLAPAAVAQSAAAPPLAPATVAQPAASLPQPAATPPLASAAVAQSAAPRSLTAASLPQSASSTSLSTTTVAQPSASLPKPSATSSATAVARHAATQTRPSYPTFGTRANGWSAGIFRRNSPATARAIIPGWDTKTSAKSPRQIRRVGTGGAVL